MKRRGLLEGAGAALVVAALPAAAQTLLPRREIAPLVAAVTGGVVPETAGVEVELPVLAENGNSVPMRIRVASPMSAADRVTAIHVFAERNPRPQIAAFHFGPGAARAEVATRVRLAGTQKVVVLASLSGGRYRIGEMEVVVTSAACLDEAL